MAALRRRRNKSNHRNCARARAVVAQRQRQQRQIEIALHLPCLLRIASDMLFKTRVACAGAFACPLRPSRLCTCCCLDCSFFRFDSLCIARKRVVVVVMATNATYRMARVCACAQFRRVSACVREMRHWLLLAWSLGWLVTRPALLPECRRTTNKLERELTCSQRRRWRNCGRHDDDDAHARLMRARTSDARIA